MQIETWNILLNALIAVLLVGYGIWLRNVFRHQLAAKDSTIESLGAAITAHEAEIKRLRGETAPAIAEAYKRLKELAEFTAAESNELAKRLKAAEAARVKADPIISSLFLANRLAGFVEASVMVRKRFEEVTNNPNALTMTPEELLVVMTHASQDLVARNKALTQEVKEAAVKLQ